MGARSGYGCAGTVAVNGVSRRGCNMQAGKRRNDWPLMRGMMRLEPPSGREGSDMDRHDKMRNASYLLPDPGGEVVRGLLDEIAALKARIAELEAQRRGGE